MDGKFATIEKIIVDLRVEADALSLLDTGEYQNLVANLTARARISVGTLIQYAKRRSLAPETVFSTIIN